MAFLSRTAGEVVRGFVIARSEWSTVVRQKSGHRYPLMFVLDTFCLLLSSEMMVRAAGLEPTASWSQTTRAANCAMPGYGTPRGIRTPDPRLKRALLCLLSYGRVEAGPVRRPAYRTLKIIIC